MTYDQLASHPRWGSFKYRDLPDGAIEIDPDWTSTHLIRIATKAFGKIRCHMEAAAAFQGVDSTLEANGWLALVNTDEFLKNIAGVWVPRHLKWNPKGAISFHSWGTAIDLNIKVPPDYKAWRNPVGGPANQPPELVQAFKANGFFWGNDYQHAPPDPMHFSYGALE